MAVREGMLAVLARGPRHGYQVKSDFESMTGGVWRLNAGQVYTTLDRLERDGMVAVDDSTETKIYSITGAGEDELARWWSPVLGEQAPPRDELVLKVLAAVDRGRDHALAVITAHRTSLTSLLQQRRAAMRSAGGKDDLAARLVDEAVIVRAESDLRWLDQCESRLAAPGREGRTR